MSVVRLEIFFDFVGPLCWLAEPALQELLAADPEIEVVRRACAVRPASDTALDPGREDLRRAWRSSVHPLAQKLGILMKLPPFQPCSRLAHEAAHWARTQERVDALPLELPGARPSKPFDTYHAAIFRAFFERGEDIGTIEVLTALAAGVGLDADALRRALESRELQPLVLADEREAKALGVTTVPAFIANRKAALSGVQPVESLRRLVGRVRSAG